MVQPVHYCSIAFFTCVTVRPKVQTNLQPDDHFRAKTLGPSIRHILVKIMILFVEVESQQSQTQRTNKPPTGQLLSIQNIGTLFLTNFWFYFYRLSLRRVKDKQNSDQAATLGPKHSHPLWVEISQYLMSSLIPCLFIMMWQIMRKKKIKDNQHHRICLHWHCLQGPRLI